MQTFLIKLFIAIGVIWLVQTILNALELQQPAQKIIFVITILIAILWLLFDVTSFVRL